MMDAWVGSGWMGAVLNVAMVACCAICCLGCLGVRRYRPDDLDE